MGEKEKKVAQGLRDEAVQEKANDELSESAGEGISDTLDALREERIEKNQSHAKLPLHHIKLPCHAKSPLRLASHFQCLFSPFT